MKNFINHLMQVVVGIACIATGAYTIYNQECVSIQCKYSKTREAVSTVYVNLEGYGSLGTGTYIAPHYVLTAEHVIGSDTDGIVQMTTDQGSTVGYVIGSNTNYDMAIIYTPYKKGVVMELADSRKVRTGDMVYTVGSPVNLTDTLGLGYVASPIRHDFIRGRKVIQYAASNYHGNSGGGLFNEDGQILGIVSYYKAFPFFMFAIEINQMKPVIKSIIDQHKGFLQQERLEANGVKVNYKGASYAK